MNVPELAARLGASPRWVRARMDMLLQSGLVAHQPAKGCHWRIDPDSAELVVGKIRPEAASPSRQLHLLEIL